ncbi:MAG TPA: hypothetical protein VF903_10400, partial [Nitrospirota bacterium]
AIFIITREDMSTAAKKGVADIKETKKIIAETLRQTGIIDEKYTGEVTVGINDGGVMFIRKSETLK